jgi:uncharacterized SAM-dependent methyltransferase
MGFFRKKAPEPKINDLIFKELIKRGYSLEGNTRVWNIADSKLWYLTPEQAQAYLDAVEKAPDYKREMIDKEIDLLSKNMPEIGKSILKANKEITMIDIGCGDGKKAVVPINYLKKFAKIVYCPIDISSYMVEQAIEKISKMEVDKVVKFQWNISDFENLENVTSLLRQNGQELFMLFLGGTLGNFEMHEVLYAISDSMQSGDSLLIGVALGNHKLSSEDFEKSYTTPQADFFLGKVLEQIGFKRDEITFGARFRNSRVECFYSLKEDKTIDFQARQIKFNKGDQIIVSYSYKYNIKQFEEGIKLYFKNYKFFTNEDKTWALILCKK